jgi:hypothetical protein
MLKLIADISSIAFFSGHMQIFYPASVSSRTLAHGLIEIFCEKNPTVRRLSFDLSQRTENDLGGWVPAAITFRRDRAAGKLRTNLPLSIQVGQYLRY